MVDRDDVVSEALRSLEVPEHRPGFWAELSERLDEEWTTAPASRVPALDRSMDPTGAGKRRGLGARWLALRTPASLMICRGVPSLNTRPSLMIRARSHTRSVWATL